MSSSPAPGLDYHSRSFSTDKIDHLLSAPVSSPTAVPLEGVESGREQRYSYDIKTDPATVLPSKPQWRPFILSTRCIGANIVLLTVMAILVELWYWMNVYVHGLVPSRFVRTHDSFVPYLNVFPAVLALLVVLPWFEIDRLIKLVQPHVSMSRNRSLAAHSVLLNYSKRSRFTILPQLIRNKHVTPLLTTIITLLALLVVAFSAGFLHFAPVPTGTYISFDGVVQTQRLFVPEDVPWIGLIGAAAYANARAIYGVNPPANVWFHGATSWSVAAIAHDDFKSNAIIKANTVAVESTANCETPELVYNAPIITATAFGCTFTANITAGSVGGLYDEYTSTDSSTFGLTAVESCGDGIPQNGSVSRVMFWDALRLNNTILPEATICQAETHAYRANVLYNSTNSAVLGVYEASYVTEADRVGYANLSMNEPWIVTSETLDPRVENGPSLNGLFMNYDTETRDTIMNSVQERISFAIDAAYRNNINGPFAASSFAAAHLNATLEMYGNYLGVAARQLYFEDTSEASGTTVRASYHPIENRLYVSGSVAHTLFVLLILMAIAGSAALHFHRHDRRQYALYSAPGSIAHAISISATSDLPSILRSTDTSADMRSALQEYTFVLNRETGGVVMGDRSPEVGRIPNQPTYVEMMDIRERMRNMTQGRSG